MQMLLLACMIAYLHEECTIHNITIQIQQIGNFFILGWDIFILFLKSSSSAKSFASCYSIIISFLVLTSFLLAILHRLYLLKKLCTFLLLICDFEILNKLYHHHHHHIPSCNNRYDLFMRKINLLFSVLHKMKIISYIDRFGLHYECVRGLMNDAWQKISLTGYFFIDR